MEDIGADYTLIICEKPDAARQFAEALGRDSMKTIRMNGVDVFRFGGGAEEFVVCAAVGHLYSISGHFKERGIFPIFDLDWLPSDLVKKETFGIGRRIEAIRRLASNAKSFVNACDFDVEGETIAYNILKYACGGKEDVALRVKFSTLAEEEIVVAFASAKVGIGHGLARAGRTRHAVDYIWGINLSRILSESLNSNNRYRTVSVGRVQGPTLAFVIGREIDIRTFVPTPYWTVKGVFGKNALRITVPYSGRVFRKVDADRIKKDCEGMGASVSQAEKTRFKEPAPPSFNIGDLQKEAFRVFGFSPSRTAQLAERLYLGALISYPRTDSQRIPPSLNYDGILRNLGKMDEYRDYVNELLEKSLAPRQGGKDDPAHPAIHPTGEAPRRWLQSWERRLFDLITRRFLASFADDAIFERMTARINVGRHEFGLSGRRSLRLGWRRYYGYTSSHDAIIPELNKGDSLQVLRIDSEENFEDPPSRFNQSSLLQKMEDEEIGTKATRAETINTLIKRGYLSGTNLMPTDFGFSVVETMQVYSPQVISTELTREVERRLDIIERSTDDGSEAVEETINLLFTLITTMKPFQGKIGRELNGASVATNVAQNILGPCPICGTGKLRMIRSVRTRKRFVGCTNYDQGCRASAPLPQKGIVKSYSKTCEYCRWPIVYVITRKRPWKLCINPNCESKQVKRRNL